MDIVSSGEVFRGMAKKKNMNLQEFSELAEESEEVDRKLDERMIEKAQPGKILEGRLTGHLLDRSDKKGFKVWLKAPLEIRVKRIMKREGSEKEVKEIKERVKKRQESERKRYKEYYDIDLLDTSIYDLIVDSKKYKPEEIVENIIERVIDEVGEAEDKHHV